MKKVLIVIVLLGLGYWGYTHFYSSPLLGEWVPNEEEFMKEARNKGISEQGAQKMKTFLANTKWTIKRDGKIDAKYPDASGELSYKAEDIGGGCYDMTTQIDSQVSYLKVCVEGDSMTMQDKTTGKVEYFKKK